MGWTLADIISKVRAVTGRPDASMISDAVIVDYINKFYQFVLPKELKIFFGYTYYNFFTQPNRPTYPAPDQFSYQTVNPTAYVDGFPLGWYLSPDLFYQDYPDQSNRAVVAQGDGSTNNFTFTVPAYPVMEGSLYVTDGTQVAQDDGLGGFVNPLVSPAAVLVGSLDYVTGTVTNLQFPLPPAANANITAVYQNYTAHRPQAILYYNNVFTLRWVPDQVYLIKMQAINVPAAFDPLVLAAAPFRQDLGPLIAYGAALEIFSNYNQMDQYDQTLVQYNRYKDVSMQDTYEEYLYQRSVPKF